MNSYKILNKQVFKSGDFSIVPIRMEDRYAIMQWRNEQMYHLRQNQPLTEEDQELYFKNVVFPLFEKKQPDQILFSYLKGEECIGYGGLVHVNWMDKNAEISFIMNTQLEKEMFEFHWTSFLGLIEEVAFKTIGLYKIFTYAFDLRPHIYPIFILNGYKEEARLRDHTMIKNSTYCDIVIHSKLIKNYESI